MVHYLRRLPVLCLVSAFALHAMEKEESPMPLDPNNTQWIREYKELYLRSEISKGPLARLKTTNQVREKIDEAKREINFLSEYLVSPNPELSKENIEQSLEKTRSRLLTFNALYEIRQDEERKAAATAQRSLKNIFIPSARKKDLVETISAEENTNNIDELKKYFDTHTKLKQEALEAGDS